MGLLDVARGWFRPAEPPAAPPAEPMRYATDAEARAASKDFNHRFAAHLNRWEGYMEAVAEGDGWQVIERRTRDRPRAGFDPGHSSSPGPHAGV